MWRICSTLYHFDIILLCLQTDRSNGSNSEEEVDENMILKDIVWIHILYFYVAKRQRNLAIKYDKGNGIYILSEETLGSRSLTWEKDVPPEVRLRELETVYPDGRSFFFGLQTDDEKVDKNMTSN